MTTKTKNKLKNIAGRALFAKLFDAVPKATAKTKNK